LFGEGTFVVITTASNELVAWLRRLIYNGLDCPKFAEGARRSAAMPRRSASIYGRQRAEIPDHSRAALVEIQPQRLNERFRYNVGWFGWWTSFGCIFRRSTFPMIVEDAKPIPTRRVLEAVLWISQVRNGVCCAKLSNYKTVHRRFQGLVPRWDFALVMAAAALQRSGQGYAKKAWIVDRHGLPLLVSTLCLDL
jgi:hypothetical protein